MANTKFMVLEFNGSGSNHFHAGTEQDKVISVTFRNEGTVTAQVRLGGLGAAGMSLATRESNSFANYVPGNYDSTSYYVVFPDTPGTKKVIAVIQIETP